MTIPTFDPIQNMDAAEVKAEIKHVDAMLADLTTEDDSFWRLTQRLQNLYQRKATFNREEPDTEEIVAIVPSLRFEANLPIPVTPDEIEIQLIDNVVECAYNLIAQKTQPPQNVDEAIEALETAVEALRAFET